MTLTGTIAITGNCLGLLDRCLQGDLAARQELAIRISKLAYQDTHRAAFSLNLHLNREDYDDINQDVLIKLFANDCRKLRTFSRRSSLERWVYVIVYNCMVDRSRSADEKKRRCTSSIQAAAGTDPESPTLEESLTAENPDPREILGYRSLVESLRTGCKAVLTEEEQTILDLWCSRQYTTNEIAGLMGRKPTAISTLIFRAQAKILEYLREKEPDTV